MDVWPADHAIGIYLSVDGDLRPVGTARNSRDVPHLLRHLASAWETYGSLPVPDFGDVYFADLSPDGLPTFR